MLSLPRNIILTIFKYLNYRAIINLKLTCKKFANIKDMNIVSQSLLINKFSFPMEKNNIDLADQLLKNIMYGSLILYNGDILKRDEFSKIAQEFIKKNPEIPFEYNICGGTLVSMNSYSLYYSRLVNIKNGKRLILDNLKLKKRLRINRHQTEYNEIYYFPPINKYKKISQYFKISFEPMLKLDSFINVLHIKNNIMSYTTQIYKENTSIRLSKDNYILFDIHHK